MKGISYRDRDYAFGEAMLALRAKIGLTQIGLAHLLGVSRRAVTDWEAGNSYPKLENLKQLVELALKHQAFPSGGEAEQIRVLWHVSHQRVLLDEAWLGELLTSPRKRAISSTPSLGSAGDEESRTSSVKLDSLALPSQPTSFVGRANELAEIDALLGDPACRLLTLVGPGGIGKTRLALQVATHQIEKFHDGVIFVGLAPVSAPNQIVSAIGGSLRLSFSGQSDPRLQLLEYLQKQHMLLLLDSFEHLPGGAELVAEILTRAPHVIVLVTSRERLNLSAEWLFDVGGLSYPSSDPGSLGSPGDMADLSKYSAVQLFIQRATQMQAVVPLSDATLAMIVRICQHVGGMPLAIELAAANMRLLPIAEIEQQIRSNVDMLSTTLRDVAPRHRSMRAVFDHSWNLLSESEQALFSRLSVFRSGFTGSAAVEVAGADLSVLMTLVDKSLLQLDTTKLKGQNEPRFVLLEPLRDYALEKLTARGELEALQRLHASYYLAMAEEAEAHWDSPTSETFIERLDCEYDNMRAVLHWARDGGDHKLGLQLAGALWRFWRLRGHFQEGRAWLEELLNLSNDSSDAATLTVRLRALNGAAWLASLQPDFAHAALLFEQSMALRRALGATVDDASLLDNTARAWRSAGEYQRATPLMEEALAQHRALGDQGSLSVGGLGYSLYELGLVLREQGDFARATALFEECVEFHRALGDREGMSFGLLALSDVARDQGNITHIREFGEESLAIMRELGVQWAIGFALNNLALGEYLAGDLTQAFAFASESVSLYRAQEADTKLAEVLLTLGQILRAQGDLKAAEETLTEALKLALVMGPRLIVAAALERLAGVTLDQGKVVLSVHLLSAASALRTQMGTPVRPSDQPGLESIVASARSALGADAFTTMWAKAQELPLEQILNLAQESPPVEGISDISSPPVLSEVGPLVDWDDALAVPDFYGRQWELNLLNGWVITEHCRVVSIVGLGGIGKSALAVSLMHQVAAHFEAVIWRSLRDLPNWEMLLDSLLQVVAPQALGDVNASLELRQTSLLEFLRGNRVLLVLDNLESVLKDGEDAGHLLPGYEGIGRFLRLSAETEHQSCVLLTSREKSIDLIAQEGIRSPVRTLRLTRLDGDACEKLLTEKQVKGSPADRARLINAYAGNPLALKIVAQSIVDLFDGEIEPFLEQGEIIYGGIRELLDEQFVRLSALEQSVLLWLAILREPATLDEISAMLVKVVPQVRLLEAIEGLSRCSLIERGQLAGSFTLQSVVLEYVTARLITEAGSEIEQGRLGRLIEHGLELASAHEYVRQTQERLILAPLLVHLRTIYSQYRPLEEQLLSLLAQLATQDGNAQGYGPANLVALLRLQRGNLRGLNLSHLVLRGVYLQGIEMQDATLAEAIMRNSLFTETFGAVTAVAISGNGEYWAAAGRRGEVRVWAADGQALHRMWRAHADMVWTIAFSPDGRIMASGSWDCSLKLWEVATGALLWSGKHASYVNSVVFSPDGSRLASGGSDSLVRLWNVRSGVQLDTLPHPGQVSMVAWGPDERLLATGDAEGYIRLWQLKKNDPARCLQTIAGHTNWVDGLAFAADGHTLATASWDGIFKLWNISTLFDQGEDEQLITEITSGRPLQTLSDHAERMNRVAWSPDGRIIASGGFEKTIRLWEVETGSYGSALLGHTNAVTGLAFTPDSHSLLSGSEDGTLRVWDIPSGQCIRVLQGYAASLYDIDWSPDGSRLVSGGSDGLVTIYAVTGKTTPRVLRGHTGLIFGVGWSPDGQYLASGAWDTDLRLWDPTTGDCLQVIRDSGDPEALYCGVAWSPNGQWLASASQLNFRRVLVWDVSAGFPLWVSKSYPAQIRRVAWSPDGTRLAGGDDNGQVIVWDGSNGTQLHWLSGHQRGVRSVAWSSDGTRLASAGGGIEGGELFVWDSERGERLSSFAGHPGIIYAVVWTSGKEFLVSGGGDGKLRWWDVKSGKCIQVREAHQGSIQSLRRSPDGTKLASCGNDGAIKLWDINTGEYLRTLRRDRPYERLNITGIRGLTEAQKATLRALGAIEETKNGE